MTDKQMKYFRRKGAMSVIDAVRIAYERLPRKFYGSILVEKVIHLTGRYGMYQETALRKMRLLRQRGELDFECLSAIDSYYKKL